MAGAGPGVGARLKSEAASMGPKLGRPTLKQPTFNWSTMNKYSEFWNFKLEASNVFQTYNANNTDRVIIINTC